MPKSPFIVALDVADKQSLINLVDKLDPTLCRVKVGKELFTAMGVIAVDMLHQRGFEVFLDLKFHDIPNTVAQAVKSAAQAGVWMVNVHASGGLRMMSAAREALDAINSDTLLIAVTVLTSMSEQDFAQIGMVRSLEEQVLHLAALAQSCQLDGVVCSAREASQLRAQSGSDFLLVTPGIRPENSSTDDQQRICTPQQALALGSDYLVIGRPVTQAADPTNALLALIDSL